MLIIIVMIIIISVRRKVLYLSFKLSQACSDFLRHQKRLLVLRWTRFLSSFVVDLCHFLSHFAVLHFLSIVCLGNISLR